MADNTHCLHCAPQQHPQHWHQLASKAHGDTEARWVQDAILCETCLLQHVDLTPTGTSLFPALFPPCLPMQ